VPEIGKMLLSWSVCKGADTYIVSRATSAEGPFTEISSYHSTSPTSLDGKVDPGTTYYYRVAAKNAAGVSEASATTSATAVQAPMQDGLPDGWTQVDLGTCVVKGAATYNDFHGGTIAITGSGFEGIGAGSNIYDGFSFVYKKQSSDFTFTARRTAVGGEGLWPSRRGLMVRESLNKFSKAVAIVVGDLGGREARFGGRTALGYPFSWQYGNGYSNGTLWFRIKRTGDQFTGYQSIDGETWHQVGDPVTVRMASDVYVGFAVSSDNDKTNNVTFDDITIK
jgi:regulation of enolase protein 1 (concanavalin A-like superfamily)